MTRTTRNRELVTLATVLLIISVLTAACTWTFVTEEGSGNVISETREVQDFDEIVLSGSGEVNVTVTGTESLMIEADDNILPLLETEVRGGRLELGAKQSISPSQPIVYTITAAGLEGLTVSGSGTIVATGVETNDLSVDISGSGEVEAAGLAGTLDLSISGSGEFLGEDLISPVGDIRVSGSGYALVNATDSLDVSISGSGDVEYIGSPQLSVSQSGSGEVSARD